MGYAIEHAKELARAQERATQLENLLRERGWKIGKSAALSTEEYIDFLSRLFDSGAHIPDTQEVFIMSSTRFSIGEGLVEVDHRGAISVILEFLTGDEETVKRCMGE